MRRALEIYERSLGHEHPNVASQLSNLAQLLKTTKQLKEAEKLIRRALAIDEASYGPEQPNVGRDLNILAHLLQATNRRAEVEPLIRRALVIDEASFGPEHPNVAIDLNTLAHLLKDTNRLKEAEPLMRRAVEVLHRFAMQSGHEHLHWNAILDNYWLLLKEMGQTEDEAEANIGSLIESVQNNYSR